MRVKGLVIIEKLGKTLKNQNAYPRRWNAKTLWSYWGYLGCQFLAVVAWSYYLRLARTIPRWKYFFEYYSMFHKHLHMVMGLLHTSKNCYLGDQNFSISPRPKELLKIVIFL